MGAITDEIPKPMLTVQGRPILEHILRHLETAGFQKFFIVVGYRHEVIEEYFRNWHLPVQFRVQEPVNGTGSAARLAKNFAATEPFLLTWGDILCDPAAYKRCLAIFGGAPDAVLAVKAVEDPYQGAAVYEEDGRVTHIIEKPPKGQSTTRWNNAGIFVFRPRIFDYLARLAPSSRNEYELTSALEMMLGDGLDLRISAIEGDWRDIGRPEDLAAANDSSLEA